MGLGGYHLDCQLFGGDITRYYYRGSASDSNLM